MIAKALLGAATLLVSQPAIAATFSSTITLGSVVLGVMVVALAGVFTIRSNVATIWHEEADAAREKAERLAAEKQDVELAFKDYKVLAAQEKSTFERQQQALRHELKDELAGCKAQLEVERSKPDLSALMQRIGDQQQETAKAIAREARAAVTEAATHAAKVGDVVDEVHVLVNSQREELEKRNAELEAQMRERDQRIQALEDKLGDGPPD